MDRTSQEAVGDSAPKGGSSPADGATARVQHAVDRASVVTYDGVTFSVRGERVLLLAGSVHYPRVHPARWDAIFAGMRASGLNTIETYVFWGEHAPDDVDCAEEDYDFTGRRDLFGFLAAAAAAGLHAILRIGPYVCAEVSYGGFPSSMRDKPGMRFRTVNEPFQAAVRRWLLFLAKQLRERKLLAGDGGPILLVQLENEYQMIAGAYGDAGEKYLKWCADLQHELRLAVPTIMCFGAPAEGAVETINAFYAHEDVDALRRERPGQPMVWTECWTGWYDVWGAPHHRRPAKDLAYAVARFFAAGGAGHCYYMWMGGSNFGRTPMYLQATSYDYDAPIDEFGMETTKSRHLSKLHAVILEKYKPLLMELGDRAHAEGGGKNSQAGKIGRVVFPKAEQLCDLTVFVWSASVVFFCNDSDHTLSWSKPVQLPSHYGISDVPLAAMEPLSVRIVDVTEGVVLYDSAVIASDSVVKRVRIAANVEQNSGWSWRSRCEPLPSNRRSCKAVQQKRDVVGEGIATKINAAPEQLALTKDSSDYCWYSAGYELKNADPKALETVVFEMEACDYVHVYVNGFRCGHSNEPLWEDRLNNKWNMVGDPQGFVHRVIADISRFVEKGSTNFRVDILVCSLGLVKGDWQLGEGALANMLKEAKGLRSDVSVSLLPKAIEDDGGRGGGGGNIGGQCREAQVVAVRVVDWEAAPALDGETFRWMDGFDNSNTEESNDSQDAADVRADPGKSRPTWFETTVVPNCIEKSWVLDLGSMGKGLLWVNGVLLGRYWDVAGTRTRNGFLTGSPIVQDAAGPATQRFYHIPPWVVREGNSEPELRITLFEERVVVDVEHALRSIALLCVE